MARFWLPRYYDKPMENHGTPRPKQRLEDQFQDVPFIPCHGSSSKVFLFSYVHVSHINYNALHFTIFHENEEAIFFLSSRVETFWSPNKCNKQFYVFVFQRDEEWLYTLNNIIIWIRCTHHIYPSVHHSIYTYDEKKKDKKWINDVSSSKLLIRKH